MLVSTAELVGTERVCQLTAVPTSTGQNLWVLSFFALTCQHLSVPSVWRDDGFHRSTCRNRAHVQGIAPCTLTVVSAGQYLSVLSFFVLTYQHLWVRVCVPNNGGFRQCMCAACIGTVVSTAELVGTERVRQLTVISASQYRACVLLAYVEGR